MKCSKCQIENPKENNFCRKCGTKLVASCPQCGADVLQDDQFCGKCGHHLKEADEPPHIDYQRPQSYTPKFLADKILTTRGSIEGERKLVTVLFADVAGFTSISEKLDPEEVHQMMDGCFKILMEQIHRHEGTINQFTGDGVMALFGAPVSHEDHAQRACYAALAIQKALAKYSKETTEEWDLDFKMRIGLNSGPVVVGSIGDDLRMDYTAVGDTTNLASRLESMASPGTSMVSENTYKIVKDFFEFQALGEVQVKGKEKALEAYELKGVSDVETRIDAAVAKGLTKFVGRRNSLGALRQALEKALSGAGQVVALVGEAGVGKSRLLFEMRNQLLNDEWTYLEGRCLHFGGSMAYLPILGILRSYFGIKEGDRERMIKQKMTERVSQLDAALEESLAPLQELLSLRVDDEAYLKLDPKQKREKAFEAIRNLLIRESQNKPVIIVVEDLHWIDKTSEEFLDYLIGWLASTPLLLILLYRPEYTHHWGNKTYYTRIGLNQLGTESSTKLLQAILAEAEMVPELKEFILTRAGGNPLYVEELTRSLIENGSLEKKDSHYVLSTKASNIEVPDTVQGIIAARMDRLEDDLKQLVQVASVIGKDFGFRVLQTITGMQEELKSHLLRLQGSEFIYEKKILPELEYIFKHALIQEVAYNSLLLKKRKEIHENIGHALEKIYPERTEEFYEILAYHYSRSETFDKAYQYLKLSAEKAMRNHSTWETFRYCKEAVDVLNQLPASDENKREKVEVLRLMTIPMRFLGYPEDSLSTLQEGGRLAKDIKDDKSQIVFYSRLGNYYTIKGGDPLLGIKYSEISFRHAIKIKDIELIARTGWDLCASYTISGHSFKSSKIAQKIIILLEKTNKEHESYGTGVNLHSVLNGYCGHNMGWLGNYAEGKVLLDKGIRFASEINDKSSLGLIEYLISVFFIIKGDGKSAIEHSQNAVKYLEEVKWSTVLSLAWSCLGHGYYLLGELEDARKYVEQGMKLQGDTKTFWCCTHSLALSMVHHDAGDPKNAQDCIQKALRQAQDSSEKHWEGYARIWLGRILGKKNPSQSNKDKEYILQGIQVCDELRIRPFSAQGHLFLGELYANRGQAKKALEHLKKAEVMLQEMGMDYWLAETRKVLGKV
jgi:class 3 adenylate cyclase/tetratricopeptide (TPR) repeat protein